MGESGGRLVVDPTSKTKTKMRGKKTGRGEGGDGAPLLSNTYWRVHQ